MKPYFKQRKLKGQRPNSSPPPPLLSASERQEALDTDLLNWNPALPLPSWVTFVKLLHLGLGFWTWKMGRIINTPKGVSNK